MGMPAKMLTVNTPGFGSPQFKTENFKSLTMKGDMLVIEFAEGFEYINMPTVKRMSIDKYKVLYIYL